MVKTKTIALLILLFAGAPAFAQKVFIDYDKNFDRDSISTFQWRDSEESLKNKDPLLDSRIVNGIKHYLSDAGLTEVQEGGDVFVTYHGSKDEKVSINTTSLGYGYPGGWAYGGYYGYYGYAGVGTTTTSVNTYELGTLVIDVWDSKSNKLVWRGMATDITITANPEKMAKKIDTALKKLVAKWEKVLAKEGKTRAKAAKS